MSVNVSRRALLCGSAALLVAGCVTAERPIPLAEVAAWRIAEVQTEYAPDAVVNLDNFATLLALQQMGSPQTGTGVPDISIDPAGGGRNLVQERIIELNATPEVQAGARRDAARIITERYRSVFAAQPAGRVPVRMRVIVGGAESAGDAARLLASAVFEDVATGRVLLRSEAFGHFRPSRRAQAVSALIGGGLIGLTATVLVAAALDGGRPEPFLDVCDVAAGRLKEWLLKP